jgi:hypothetical protein
MSEAPFDTNCAQPNFAAKHLILRLGSSGKVHQFSVYFNCDLFDTPENGVITSGLILASVLPVLGLSNRITRGLKNLATNVITLCDIPFGNWSGNRTQQSTGEATI